MSTNGNTRPSIKSFRDLEVWKRSMDLVVKSYELSRRLPTRETYGLASQMQRAAVSIPANIAEGHGRDHLGDYLRHLSIANGSLRELETHLIVPNRLNYLSTTDIEPACAIASEVGRMLSGLSRRLRSRQIAKPASVFPAT
jgi:four helix bundle protein